MNGTQMEGYAAKRHRSDDMGGHDDSMHGEHGPPRKRKDLEPMPPNHILLFTVLNPVYHPITVDILHTICSTHARVIRIVIFKRYSVQAMIEFESVEAACAVREALNGADIYSGCCTLQIDFAKPERLNVIRNGQRSWDYTVSEPRQDGDVAPVKKVPLLPEPPAPFPGGGPKQGSVVMVYDMDKNRMNPERLFNIFCQYGNVLRVKFLRSKEGCAMIQLEDGIAVERALANLNGVEFFGCRIQLSCSKQPYLNEVQQPHTLPDGTSSFGDFTRNRNNRFLDPARASKNRIQAPSRILHFYNMPPGMSDDEINELFTSHELAQPESIKMFPARSERSCSGLMEFSTVAEAVEGLAVCNNMPVSHADSRFPYTLRLCFSV